LEIWKLCVKNKGFTFGYPVTVAAYVLALFLKFMAALFEESSSNKIQPKSWPQTAGDEIHWIRPDPVDIFFSKKLENALDFGEIQ
jgi:hypothetical protein